VHRLIVGRLVDGVPRGAVSSGVPGGGLRGSSGMRLVVQNDKKARRDPKGSVRRGAGVRGGLAGLAVAALASGCTPPGTQANPAPGQQRLQAPPARALDAYANRLRTSYEQRAAATRRWGLERVPLPA